MHIFWKLLLLLVLQNLPFTSFSKPFNKHFKVIDISNGLPNNTVKCIAQDKFGFMWFGTYDGLSRYDGVNFTTYRHSKKDPFSISNNFITSILPTNDGLWIGTGAGISFLSFTDHKFYQGKYLNANNEKVPIKGIIRNIINVDSKIVILSEYQGILLLDQDHLFKTIDFNLKDPNWQMIAPYKDGNFLAHSIKGLFILNLSSASIKSNLLYTSMHPADHIYFNKTDRKIYVGSGIGRDSKVFQESGNQLKMLPEMVPMSLKTMINYKDGLLFGTDGNGLIFSEQGKSENFIPKNSNISSDAIYALFVDRENNLWIGTFRGGINVYSDHNNWFKSRSTSNSPLKHDFVTSIYQSSAKTLYLGTDGGGLNVFDASGNFASYTSSNSNIFGNNVVSVAGDKDHIWMVIYGKGLSCFNPSSKTFTNYALPQFPNSQERNSIWVIKDDQKGNLWVGSEGGLFTFNKKTRTFNHIESDISKISEISFSQDAVWVSTNGRGLYQLDYAGKIIKKYSSEDKNSQLKNNFLRYLFVDSKQNVWFGTEHTGLYKLIPKTGEIHNYGPEQGFENPNVLGITEDNNNNLWISSYNGLFRFNMVSNTFIRFGEEDHIPSAQFNYNACYQNDGLMYFGSSKGLITFNPDEIVFDHKFKKVVFTDFELLNQRNENLFQYKSPIQVINLPYNHNFFSISFTIPELISPDKIKYSFYLDNFESTWSPGGSRRQVTYTNVPPGEYNFSVKSTNTVGEWNKEYSILKVIISPPWWKTNWATLIFIILILCVIIALLVFYRYQINIKHMVQLKDIEKNTEKNINEAKLTFFTNISHELRTPIFLLTAPLEDLLKTKGDFINVKRGHLSAMFKNALRLNKLISRIIDFRKLEVGRLYLELQTGNVVAFCKALVPEYEVLCQQKNILLLFLPSKLDISLTFDSEKLESILSNLISNGFKYSDENGKIILSIDEDADNVIFTIEDNGIGIKEEHYEKIFDRFFQIDRNLTVGDGIGLAFVKHLVELHGGMISVTGKLNVGSKFTFSIPKNLEERNESADPKSTAENQSADSTGLPLEQTKEYPNPSASYTALIVDDEVEIQSLIERLFIDNFRIIKASNGVEALERVKESTPDIIICDMMMPKMNGMDFIAKLKSNKLHAKIPIVVLTAKTGEEDMINAYGYGADAYLTKPVSIKFLKHRISQILTQSESTDLGQFITGEKTNYSKLERKFMMMCQKIMDENLTNPEFNVLSFSKELGMSHSSFYKKLKSMTGKSIIEFINAYRIYKAMQLFNEGERNISIAGNKCGFNDPKSFRDAFKQRMGVTPKYYLQTHKDFNLDGEDS